MIKILIKTNPGRFLKRDFFSLMKVSSLFLIAPALFIAITASPVTSSTKSPSHSSKLYLSELEIEELLAKNGKELETWINEKRLEYDIIYESSLTSGDSASSKSTSPIPSPKSSVTNSPKSSSTSSTISSSTPSPKTSFTASTISNFDQKMLVSLGDSIRARNNKLTAKLINCIPNWKMTFKRSNFSVLSLIAMLAKKKYLGQLIRSDALEYFRPLITGKAKKFACAYFLTLSLFHPTIQTQVMNLLIKNAPNLRGILLINSIYYNLHENVFNLLITSGANINFVESDYVSPLRSLPSFDNTTEEQVPITKRLYMNYSEKMPCYDSWTRNTSLDAEMNFVYGMLEVGLPDEMGALRVAFENYSPNVVMKLVELSPMPLLTNYHLAHLLAKNPEKRAGYPSIESLVDFQLALNRLMAGESDLVGLAYLSTMASSDQVQVISEFIRKTIIFRYPFINKDQTFVYPASNEVKEQFGIPELPFNSASVFFLTACKCNIDDEAFALIWNVCKNVNNKPFILAKKYASDWASTNGLLGKTQIMSKN